MVDWGDPADLTRLRLSFRSSSAGGGPSTNGIMTGVVGASASASGHG